MPEENGGGLLNKILLEETPPTLLYTIFDKKNGTPFIYRV